MNMARKNLTVVDDDGNIIDGASIEVRLETPGLPLAAVFSDRAGAVALGNPYTAADGSDAGFHARGGAYKIKATKGAFTKTWRYEALGLAQESDDFARVFFVFVTDFGATGDGITSDNVAINLAVDAIRSQGGGILWFPRGTYLVDSAIDIRGMSNLVIDGDPGVVIKASAAFDASHNLLKSSIIMGLNFTGTAPPTGRIYKNITITENITVDGTLQNQTNLPPGAIGNFGYNSCAIEIMDVDYVSIYAKCLGAYGNGPVISTHDPRLTAPTFTTYVINGAGTGYAVGDTFYSEDTGQTFAKARFRVLAVNGTGGVTSIEPFDRGIYLTFSGLNAITTNITGSGTGCQVQLGGTVTVTNAIKRPTMKCVIENCVRGRLLSYQSGTEPDGIAGSGLQIGAGTELDIDVTLINVGGPGVDFFNCRRGSIAVNVVSVNASAPIGTVQARGSFHSDFGLADLFIRARVPSVDIRGAMNNGLSYFFNGGTATPGPRRCFFDFIIDGSIAADTIGTPGFRMMGGSIAGLVGQAKDNFGRVVIQNSNGIGATLYDCVQNDIDFNIVNPGQIASHYIGMKFFSQIDQSGGGCTDNRFSLRCIDTRPLVTSIVTTDGTTRHFRNKFFPYNISVPTGAVFDLPSGTYQVYAELGTTKTVTSAGTLTLDKNSDETQILTGSTTHTVVLPVAATLPLGKAFTFYNESSGVVSVQSSGSNAVVTLAANTSARVECILNSGTTAASWVFRYFGALIFGGKRLIIQNSMTFSATDNSSVAFGGGGTVVYQADFGSNVAAFLAAPSSANLRAALTDEEGAGAAYFVGGDLGTPAAGVATNLTGLPIASGLADVAWSTYSPTITVQTPGGTPPTIAVNSARYKAIGKTVVVSVAFTVSAAGTGTGQVFIPLPTNSAAFNYAGMAFERAATLHSGAAVILGGTNATRAQAAKYDGSTLCITGYSVVVEITYEIP